MEATRTPAGGLDRDASTDPQTCGYSTEPPQALNQERILAILYDLALHIGGEMRLEPLLTHTLQRLIYHTTFPCGLVLLLTPGTRADGGPDSTTCRMLLAQAVGDHKLAAHAGEELRVTRLLAEGPAEWVTGDGFAGLPLREEYYASALRLPIPGVGVVLLLAPDIPRLHMPFGEILKPVMGNLANAIQVCRSSEAHTAALREANQRLENDKAEQQALIQRLRETQAQLLQSEKMASLGQLAAGIAHEINNPVGYIKSNINSLEGYIADIKRLVAAYETGTAEAQKLRAELDYDFLCGDIGNLIAESREGVDRVQHIVQDLKDFAHADQVEWQSADLHRGLDSTLNLVWNELKYKADVVREYGPLPPVECIARQLNQVFMNILVNAAQAIPARGTITVRTRQEGEFAVVEISDTGSGIAPDKLSHIFEPFFTTKPVGKGTGLGLSIAYGIVQKHGGRIEAESEPGHRTTFRIVLPILRQAVSAGTAATGFSA